jgi:hypothetical protein
MFAAARAVKTEYERARRISNTPGGRLSLNIPSPVVKQEGNVSLPAYSGFGYTRETLHWVPKIDNILPVITSEKGAISFLMDNDVGNFHVCPKCKHEGKHGWKKKWPSDDSPLINDNLRLKCCAPCAGTKHTWSPFVGTFLVTVL